jgi:glutamyl-Q tRNA(Asp) synthetase
LGITDFTQNAYIGRFAPSPTGPLHFGSLVTALASYLDARAHGGKWLVRIEDVDEPRTVPGAAADILRTLERFGLEWDGSVMYQSQRTEAYHEALEKLRREGLVYPSQSSRQGRPLEPQSPVSWRTLSEPEVQNFAVRRADGYFTYQLAVVVDDAAQGITNVVRGADLLDSTPRQNWLQKQLGYPQPNYLHLPVVTNEKGEKLSKQTKAPPLDPRNTTLDLRKALDFLALIDSPRPRPYSQSAANPNPAESIPTPSANNSNPPPDLADLRPAAAQTDTEPSSP